MPLAPSPETTPVGMPPFLLSLPHLEELFEGRIEAAEAHAVLLFRIRGLHALLREEGQPAAARARARAREVLRARVRAPECACQVGPHLAVVAPRGPRQALAERARTLAEAMTQRLDGAWGLRICPGLVSDHLLEACQQRSGA